MLRCRYEEDDIRIMLYAMSRGTHVVVVARDICICTDVYILHFYAMQKCKPKNEWFMCTENEKVVNIQKHH